MLTGLAPNTLYYYQVHSVDAAGNPAASGGFTFTTAPAAALAFQESAGQVVMEAENYATEVVRNGHDWTPATAKSGYAGAGYLQVLPNNGLAINSGYATASPELTYRVNFTNTGTYYVWLRGSGDTGNDDSAHAGLDGAAPTSADRITGLGSSWTWKRTTMDSSAPATLSVTSPGIHTIHLWMREDGLRLDRILLRKNSSSSAPSGSGPAESPRS
jgi:hypothetical protein